MKFKRVKINKQDISYTPYKGKAVCFKMPHDTLVTKRNGKVGIHHNCGDPDMNLIYHFGLQVDYVGTHDKIENLIPHFEFTSKRIMQAFFMNEAIMNGDASYAGQTANTRLLMHRFMTKRTNLESAFRNKIFLPIAKQQQLVIQTPGEEKKCVMVKSKRFSQNNYLLPTFMWQKQNLLNSQSERDFIVRLYEKDAIPFGIVRDIFGLDQKVIDYYRKKDQGTFSNTITRELVDNIIKDDPSLSYRFALGEDPIQLIKEKYDATKTLNETEEGMGGNEKSDSGMFDDNSEFSHFDSSAPIDLGSPRETGEEPPMGDLSPSSGDEGALGMP